MRSFKFLNATQFLDAFNENLFKYIVIYFLIFKLGDRHAQIIMSITAAIFIFPFVLFSSFGGIFADRWSKTIVIRATRFIHLTIMICALFSVIYQSVNFTYLLLALMSTTSAIFGPSKYGIIPEIVPYDKILRSNGIIAAFTFFAIILGTSFASLLDTLSNQTFYLMVIACIAISICGVILSFFIAYIPPANRMKKWPLFIYKEIYFAIVQMRNIPYLLVAVFAYSYFLFIGAFIQMNIIPFSVQILKTSPIIGGYLFIFSAIGIGIGSLIAGKLSGSLRILPYTGLGMSATCLLFVFFHWPFWLNILWLIILGVFAGLFLVPAQAFILANSKTENRGRNVATANFLSFVAALIAAGFFYLLAMFHLNASGSFIVMSILNLLVVLILYFLTKNQTNYTQNENN